MERNFLRQCFYVRATVNFNVVLRKVDTCSCEKAA